MYKRGNNDGFFTVKRRMNILLVLMTVDDLLSRTIKVSGSSDRICTHCRAHIRNH